MMPPRKPEGRATGESHARRGAPSPWKLHLLSMLVPEARRAEWREEWQGELDRAGPVAVRGAGRHALILRLHDLDILRQDVGYAARGMARRPGFSAAVVLTLTLGIGANTAVFSLVNTVVLRPLPYPDPDRLFTLFEQDSLGRAMQLASYPTFVDWREQSDSFADLVYVRGTVLALRNEEDTDRLLAAFVSDGFFSTMGIPPILGRGFDPQDHVRGADRVAVLSHDAWQTVFGGDPTVVGRTVTMGQVSIIFIGVAAPGFAFPDWGAAATDMWLPITALPQRDLTALSQRDFHADSRVIGRLAPGIDAAQARVQMDGIARRLADTYPGESARWTRVAANPLSQWVLGDVRPRLMILSGAVVVVLLVCCANLASLYAAQGTARSQEFAIRASLGAGRGRVLRQLLTESLLLTSAGGVAGVLLAVWAVGWVRTAAPRTLPRLNEASADIRVLGFAAGLSVATAIVFALAAARRTTTPALVEALKESNAAARRVGRGSWRRGWLVVSQVALTVVLLVAAGLLVKSFWRLGAVDRGFDAEHLASIRIVPPSPRYDDPEMVKDLYARVAESIRAVPGVADAALINHSPLGRGGIYTRAAAGDHIVGSASDTQVLYRTVSEGYIAMMGIRLIAGRSFEQSDMTGPPGPLIVNDVLAGLWGDDAVVGQRLTVLKSAKERPDFGQPLTGTVVGVVQGVRNFGVDVQPGPVVYVPYTHNPWSEMDVVARTIPRPERLVPAIEDALRAVDPALPVGGRLTGATTSADAFSRSYAPRRFSAALMAAFAASALLLAAVGIYGVTAYAVASQTREIGIRIALGARPGTVRRAVVARATRLALVGLAVGMVGAAAVTRLMTGLLFQVGATDPTTFIGVGLILMAVTIVASYFPARRAAAVDPVVALRA